MLPRQEQTKSRYDVCGLVATFYVLYIHPDAVQSTTSPVFIIGHAASLTYIGETMTSTEYNTNQYRDGGGSQQLKSFLEPGRNAGCQTQRFSYIE